MATQPADIMVVAEVAAGGLKPISFEMLGLARRLAETSGGTVLACVAGEEVARLGAELIAQGADRVHVAEDPACRQGEIEAWLGSVVALIGEARPMAVILGHSQLGAELAPRIAFRLGTAVATGCIAAAPEDGRLLLTRPCYGGNAHEVVSLLTAPAVFTVRAKSFAPLAREEGRRGEVVRLAPPADPPPRRVAVLERNRQSDAGVQLESAEVVVSGGGGMKGPAGFALAQRLADMLGGAVGASRVACDLGWCPPSYQVGLSGRTVAPELYLAIGISGAGQHMAGCANAKTIVAINSDPDAPIFKFAKYGIVGDCHELMPALIEEIESRRG
jgi:electron transfer flavoprotein alpha subunit